MSKYRVLFHLHEGEKGNIAFSNIINLINDLGEENLDIELLMNGTGVKVMQEDEGYIRKIEYISNKGVTFSVCSNSLKGLKIDEDGLIEGFEKVPSGVGELVKKQDKGWNYIKI
ncbi:MAG: DsrE family protein [Thermoplasmatota archaeon]